MNQSGSAVSVEVSQCRWRVSLALVALSACLIAVLAMGGQARATPVFDKSFGEDGRVQTNLDYNQVRRGGYVQDMHSLPDGRFMVTTSFEPALDTMVVVRFLANGSIDQAFGKAGILRVGFGSEIEYLENGKFIVAGEIGTGTPGQDVLVRKFNADGSIDRDFGKAGSFRHDFGAQDGTQELAVGSTGQILLEANVFCHATARVCYDSTSDSQQLILVSPDGSLVKKGRGSINYLGGIQAANDGTFRATESGDPNYDDHSHRFVRIDRNLKVTTIRDFGEGKLDWTGPTLMLPDNGLYALSGDESPDTSVVKVKPDGRIDPTFGTDGKVTCEAEPFTMPFEGKAMQLDAEGRILVSGRSPSCGLFRVLPDGTVDASFGDGGAVAFPDDGSYRGGLPAFTSGSRILLGRWDYDFGRVVIGRLRADGSRDTNFGEKKIPILQASADSAKDIVRTGNGLVVGGNSNCSGYPPQALECFGFALARYKENGSLDRSFGDAGRAIGNYMTIQSLTRLHGGKVLAAGGGITLKEPGWDGRPGFALARFTADGDLDPSFGEGGVVRTSLDEGHALRSTVALDAAVQRDGKIVVTGETTNDKHGVSEYLPVARYNANGSLDQSFDDDGILKLDLTDLSLGSAISVVDRGRILIAGRDHFDAVVLRLKPNGELDPSFGKDGIARPKLPVRSRFNERAQFTPERSASAMTVLKNGQILAGAADGHGMMDGVVFKLTPRGRLVRGFGNKGLAFTAGLTPQDITVGKCRRLTVSGGNRKSPNSSARFGVLRLRSGGGADRSFNRGRTVLPFGGVQRSKASAATISKGRVIVAGTSRGLLTNDDFALAGFSAQKKCK
ncbi:MAG: hypothetical protein JJE13_00160 [Thermoleophilia bacterium]|nr:hypothetical protein [Thermoleophilia bacterium]